MFAKMKTELSAALVLSAGLLVASGYGVTLLRLQNEGLPTEGVLSALPDSFYLGVAVENLFVPMVVLSTLGVVWIVLAVKRRPTGNVPGPAFWLGFGVLLSGAAWLLSHLASPFDITRGGGYIVASLLWGIAGVALTAGFGAFARWRLGAEVNAGAAAAPGDQLLAGAAAVLLSCVVVPVGFLAVDAAFKDTALPSAALYTDREDCPEVGPKQRTSPGCPLAGFYIGESDKWLYIVEDNRASTPSVDRADPNLPGRVLFVPRDSVRQLRLDEKLTDP